ncbi:hypothetical protein PN450_11610 [Dolichospermum lemmermannii CS-548]|uniref:hypothetical protein n=1 Tax=Dolichospermum lemmermannii TaxID=54295 RepID=UPI00232EC1D1|nr:hypothetical protein [Dolichospermum lemmermannii]MDB9437426.1 hypothetical protein [Dolichospermum lemmermannii CS-548]
MGNRRYYSIRTGKNPDVSRYDLPILLRLFSNFYLEFLNKDYFQEDFGYYCVDHEDVPGKLGSDIEAQMFRAIRKPELWPIQEKCKSYSEDDLFDVIEFLYDHVSKPIDGYFHSYNDCGYHYHTFDKKTGQQEFRDGINQILCEYKEGYELSDNGEILESPEQGLENLFAASLPTHDPDNVERRVQAAILKFRRYRSSLDERRDAIRDLSDVLEFLRPQLKTVISKKDEGDLFVIANQFGIRHHNDQQKQDYDKAIWYSWIFYYYLATIHAGLRLIKKAESQSP